MRDAGARILVVDDEEHYRNTVCSALKQKGFQVISASSGMAAYEIWSTSPVDVIISDVEMAQGSGLWLAEKVSKSKRLTPIIMASGGPITEEEVTKLGVKTLLKKPYKMKALLDVIDEVLKSGD